MNRDDAVRLLNDTNNGVREWNRRRLYGDATKDLSNLDLSNLDLRRADFHKLDLRNTNLSNSDLRHASFLRADMRGTNFKGARVGYADFRDADLREACLVDCNLRNANLRSAGLARADFSGAYLGYTTIASDLSDVVGLGLVVHTGPSEISIRSSFSVPRHVAQLFLRGVGLSDDDIEYVQERESAEQRKSCFISYSTDDAQFVSQLYDDLQSVGIRCWKWDHDARIGRSIWAEVDNAIRVHDLLVLVASKSALLSPYVIRELERAIQQEDRLNRLKATTCFRGDTQVLYPVAIDDYIFTGWHHPRQMDLAEKVVLDARGWQDSAVYEKIKDRLIRDLHSG